MDCRICPITVILKKDTTFEFTSTMEDTIHALLVELTASRIHVFPDLDAVTDRFLSDPDNMGVYFIRECGLTPLF